LFRSNDFWLSYGPWTCIFLFKFEPERNSNLNCNSSRYSHIPNIKSISQRTWKESQENFKFEKKYKFKGRNSAKNNLIGIDCKLFPNLSHLNRLDASDNSTAIINYSGLLRLTILNIDYNNLRLTLNMFKGMSAWNNSQAA
jgi:hypothetical protein